jgi:hypothetical protein
MKLTTHDFRTGGRTSACAELIWIQGSAAERSFDGGRPSPSFALWVAVPAQLGPALVLPFAGAVAMVL